MLSTEDSTVQAYFPQYLRHVMIVMLSTEDSTVQACFPQYYQGM